MEVYTPIPESAMPRSPRWPRVLGAAVLAVVLIAGVVKIGRLWLTDFNKYERFGVVETRFGPALAVCGGESALPCGEGTTVLFGSCSPEVRGYFTGFYGDNEDARVRELINDAPPSGSKWSFGCWWSGWGPLLRNPAHLRPL